MKGEYVVFDLETTGLSPERDAIVEIGALKIRDGQIREQERFETLVRPLNPDGSVRPIPWQAARVHGISDAMVRLAPALGAVLPDFLEFVGAAAVVAHNASFDSGFMRIAAQRHGLLWAPTSELCTVQLSRRAFPRERSHNLGALAQRLGLEFAPGGRHRSFGDVQVTARAFVELSRRLEASPPALAQR
ncbi:exonuclease domain-containing protein [Deinococcus rubellus]|uniref:3'-5' exonuclease n=1 Tax=Deinococcus rubellus TaxID=1889240 RepID=A0ABY5YF78_9DEIO|nr:3'-5' exonuclease [Deinococcus rubellus]UWX63596.1 3'-5' exonuclease [Deinococcus rubellus]